MKTRKAKTLLERYEEGTLLACNCAGCGQELLSRQYRDGYESHPRLPPLVGGRMFERPYCTPCLTSDMQAGQPPAYLTSLTPRQAIAVGKASS